MKDRERVRRSLLALSRQQGHYGSVDIEDVLSIIELRDERIEQLQKEIEK